MIIYPAIDFRAGKVVQLREGDPNQQTVFNDDPIRTAQVWIEQGATWIHMINLDGAFANANDNGRVLAGIARLGIPVQFGGGLRQMQDIARAIEQGATRVILGTVAVQQPEVVIDAMERWGADRVCVALDSRDGKITTHGWQQQAEMTPAELGQQMAAKGVQHALYTDVSRDGRLEGVNVEGTAKLSEDTGLQVIASGGVSTLEDIRQLTNRGGIAGVVIGTALYTGRVILGEAIAIAGGQDAG